LGGSPARKGPALSMRQRFDPLELVPSLEMPYPHQSEALLAWKQSGRNGVVLPTAAKTYLAQLCMEHTRSTLIVVPTLDLMQWYNLKAAFPDVEVGLLGGWFHKDSCIHYDSAAIHAETLGNQYALLILMSVTTCLQILIA